MGCGGSGGMEELYRLRSYWGILGGEVTIYVGDLKDETRVCAHLFQCQSRGGEVLLICRSAF